MQSLAIANEDLSAFVKSLIKHFAKEGVDIYALAWVYAHKNKSVSGFYQAVEDVAFTKLKESVLQQLTLSFFGSLNSDFFVRHLDISWKDSIFVINGTEYRSHDELLAGWPLLELELINLYDTFR